MLDCERDREKEQEYFFKWQEKVQDILNEKEISGITSYDIPKLFYDDGFTATEAVRERLLYWGMGDNKWL